MKCSNSKCQAVFSIESMEEAIESHFLCPKCRLKINTHHIVQCSNCHSLINFLIVEEGEEPIVFYTKKCHHCNGTYEDEIKIHPLINSNLFI